MANHIILSAVDNKCGPINFVVDKQNVGDKLTR